MGGGRAHPGNVQAEARQRASDQVERRAALPPPPLCLAAVCIYKVMPGLGEGSGAGLGAAAPVSQPVMTPNTCSLTERCPGLPLTCQVELMVVGGAGQVVGMGWGGC